MITFRDASEDDARLLWQWANDEEVRESAFNQKKISWETHLEWLAEKLDSDNCYLCIAERNDIPIGQIRFDLNEEKDAVVSVSIKKSIRGQGCGRELIELGTKHFLDLNPDYKVHAYVKIENKRSKKVFEKSGYELKDIETIKDYKSYHLTKG